MADETLRMEAEVRDKFTGPLKSLRAQLLDASREGAKHGETLAKGLGKAEAAAQATAKTAQTVLNPALAGLGITGLTAGVAVTGIVSALNSLGSNLSSLGQLGRETGMAAEQLRVFQSVAGKFGISTDASASAAQAFARNMREIRRGTSEISGFLQSQNPAVATFGLKLKNSTSNDEARKLTEDFLEQIPDAQDRKTFAERIFGNADFGRLGDRHLGSISKLRDSMQQKLGPLPEGAVEQAERYERAIASLRSSMQKVGNSIAIEMLGPAERFTTWIDDVVAGKRGDVTKGLREGIRGIKTELEAINWQQFGADSLAALQSTTALVGSMAKGFHDIAEAIHSLREGKYIDAIARADSIAGPVIPGKEGGADGPLRRRLAPRVGDDEIVAKQNVEDMRRLLDASREAGSHVIGRAQQRMGLLEAPEAVEKKLRAAEAELSRLQARTPEQRQRDFETATEKLRRSIDGLSEQMKTQQGATAQKSSLEGDGPFGGARIQSAAYTGGGGFRRMPSIGGANLLGGGSGPGYSGEQGERNAMREQFRQHLRRTVPGYDGGDTVPLAPGTRVSPMDSSGARLPSLESARGRPARGALAANQQEAYRAARAEGLSDTAARALVANMSGESLANPRDHHYDRTHMSQGIVQWDPQRAEAIRRKFGAYPKDMSVTDQTRAAIDEIRTNRRFGRTARALEGDDPNAMLRALVENFEAPQNTRRAIAERQRFYQGFRPDAAVADSDRPAGLPRPDTDHADGEGWAAREKARKAFDEQMRRDESRLDASAARAGVVGGTKVEANGSVSVVVQKPGPETNVRTSASGNLFKDVILRRGRTMAGAQDT